MIKDDINVMKGDITVMKDDINVMKGDITVMKDDINVMKDDITVMKGDVNVMKDDVSVTKNDVSVIKDDINGLGEAFRREVQSSIKLSRRALCPERSYADSRPELHSSNPFAEVSRHEDESRC